MKDDLISKSALLEALKTEEWAAILGNSFVRYMKAKTLIEKIPAVDAETVFEAAGLVKEAFEMAKADLVAVVRCKDCKHWMKDVPGCTDFVGRCEWANYMVGADGYCVYGERRGDDDRT